MQEVPFGGIPGFCLAAEVALIADYYGVSVRSARTGKGHAMAQRARNALLWRLATERRVSVDRVATLLKMDAAAVAAGIAAHEAEIQKFRSQNFLASQSDAA